MNDELFKAMHYISIDIIYWLEFVNDFKTKNISENLKISRNIFFTLLNIQTKNSLESNIDYNQKIIIYNIV